MGWKSGGWLWRGQDRLWTLGRKGGGEEGVECVECVDDHQLGRLMDERPWHASNLEREAGAIASQQRLSRGRLVCGSPRGARQARRSC